MKQVFPRFLSPLGIWSSAISLYNEHVAFARAFKGSNIEHTLLSPAHLNFKGHGNAPVASRPFYSTWPDTCQEALYLARFLVAGSGTDPSPRTSH